MILSGEVRNGLASIISSNCSKCGDKIILETSSKVSGPKGYQRWECNLAAVWGQLATGGGHAPLQESMSVIGIPVMTKSTFIRTEREIGAWWGVKLQEYMAEAGAEEKRIAIEQNEYHQGVPAITVIVDGGWSKRAHKHSYNAKSGVAVIIGKNTGKLLFMGVRNKFCTACTLGHSKDNHACYKNWDKSSSEMETDILLEGFCKAESTHGVRYIRFIGDGDSSVYGTLLQHVPVWGRDIEKVECSNHACKCYRGSLEKLATENPSYKGKGGLTLKMRKRLTSAARCAIKMRSKESNRSRAIKLLEEDLINGPRHCFGYHEKCSTDFCTAAQQRQAAHTNSTDETGSASGDPIDDDIVDHDIESKFLFEDIFLYIKFSSLPFHMVYLRGKNNVFIIIDTGTIQDQQLLWEETTADNPAIEDEVRQGAHQPTELSQKLLHDIQVIISRLVAKVPQLIGNFTTNLAEAWMHMRCKFDGGKVINRSQSGSWEHRCMGAGLRLNLGQAWGSQTWNEMTHSQNITYQIATEAAMKKADSDRKRKSSDKAKKSRRQNKYSKVDNSTAARRAYSRHDNGTLPVDVTGDVPADYLSQLMDTFYQTKVIVNKAEILNVESKTQAQSDSNTWREERYKRITASVVGGICKLQKKTKRSKKVESMLYSKFRGNKATWYGNNKEQVSRDRYVNYQRQHGHPNLKTHTTGLVISHENPWIAASPDDRVHDPDSSDPWGLAEYKNPYSARLLTLSESCMKSTFCLEEVGASSFRLKQRHDYFFQVQCQLYCDDKPWCDFVLCTEKDMHIERIARDTLWWNEQIPKLRLFYFNSLLPELACPRFNTGGIRESVEPAIANTPN